MGRDTARPSSDRLLIAALRTRAAGRTRTPHPDGLRIALVIEGGGMRGVVSAGMVAALEDLGLTGAFDAVYGSSAGAINGAYFLAGQAAFGATIYSEDINNRHFIDFSRPLRGRPIVDLDFLIDEVATRIKTLAVDRVIGSPTPLAVLATDVDGATATVFTGFEDRAALLRALKAGARMPIIAGDPVTIGHRRYLDASLTEPIPAASAEAAGFTHLLVLLTRPDGRERQLSWFDRLYVVPRLQRLSPELARRYEGRFGPYAATLRELGEGRGPAGHAAAVAVRPAGAAVSKLERRTDVLVAAARRGREAIQAFFA